MTASFCHVYVFEVCLLNCSFSAPDVVSIPKTNESFRLLYDTKGRFRLHSIRDEESKFKLCKVRSVQFGQKGIPYINTYEFYGFLVAYLKSMTWLSCMHNVVRTVPMFASEKTLSVQEEFGKLYLFIC
ncbi:hypothetical protein RHGRI_006519 [Rhododendron griersonianum]|uniref:Small ribosomal subunit protein eS4 central region domain-containing protein n=1 Tax=Rhododendron griersonianum TaxID=479676 RepID=A0AAV6KTE1_9ERIC|nr:hypothetical protein RHGRI_006519 [Rhododendron griersonianum]